MNKIADYNLQSLKAFLAVGATGSMTAAAAKLGLTQSAVSQAMRQLEDALGTVILDRTRRPLTLTPAGLVLQRHAQPLIEDAEALTTIVRQAGSAKIPELKLGVVDSFASTAGPSLIRALLGTTTQISFRSGLAHDQSQGLLNRKLDLIITSETMDDVDGLDRYLLFTEPFMLLVPQKMRISAPVDLKDLAAKYSLIRFSARSQMGAQIERHLRRLGVKAPRMLEVDATDSLAAMVQAGLGWAVATPLCLLQVGTKLEGVALQPFPGTGFVRQIHLICHAGEYGDLPQRVADLARDILRRECVPDMRRLVPWLRTQVVVG